MTLNLDCMRDILLEAEKCKYNETLPVRQLEKILTQYYNEIVRYNCLMLYEAGYIEAMCIRTDNSPLPYIHEIIDITYPDHEFLANIRDGKSWAKVREIREKSGALGLNSAFQIAAELASAAIKRSLGLP